ncbi:MAG: DUF6512 family protein [Candidatus Merdivicinus sp.]|jgi:hypothetical protein
MNIKKWQWIGAVFAILVGSLLHFTYEWLGRNPIAGVFSAVSESTWEHLKLLFVPMLIFAGFEFWKYGRDFPNFWAVKAFSILLGMFTIVAAFYTYTGIIGQNFMILDIGTFILGASIAYWFSYHALEKEWFSGSGFQLAGGLILIVLAIAFVWFTFSPPSFGMFLEPAIS